MLAEVSVKVLVKVLALLCKISIDGSIGNAYTDTDISLKKHYFLKVLLTTLLTTAIV